MMNWYYYAILHNFLIMSESVRQNSRWNDEKVRIVEQMFESGESPSKIAPIVNMSVRSVQRYVREHISDNEGDPWLPFVITTTNEMSSTSKLREEAILKILGNDSTLTQRQVIQLLPDDLKCTIRTVSRALKAHNITRKLIRSIPNERNSNRTIQLRRAYANQINLLRDQRLYYIDETGFNLHTGPRYGYAVAGETPTAPRPGDRQRNLSVITCVSISGIIHYDCTSGSYTSELMVEFIHDLCRKLPTDAIVIMDNAAIHKTTGVKLAFESHGKEFKFLPPWSPQLNPIEEFFSLLKGKQKLIRPRPSNFDQLVASIHNTMTQLQNRDLSGYYKHMRSFIHVARRSEPFE